MKEIVQVAAISDIHCTKTSQGIFQPLFSQITDSADVLVMCGDLCDSGLPEEARVLAKELTTAVRIPVVAVLGNHDYESGKQEEVEQIISDAGVHILNGNACEIHGVGFAGVKGFAGGFDDRALQPWGEEIIKRFVHEAVEESLKLESGLAMTPNCGPKFGLEKRLAEMLLLTSSSVQETASPGSIRRGSRTPARGKSWGLAYDFARLKK
ncbi:MAG: metallophosphoesterase [Acidobacteria bacterium]|nr:metallophosphoesterase [Acidobacteriota bacterium]